DDASDRDRFLSLVCRPSEGFSEPLGFPSLSIAEATNLRNLIAFCRSSEQLSDVCRYLSLSVAQRS
ncbi:hypothetical protein A2U01_0085581, partial [Trifolium medium]|nr:hypothetical protein [Trifolium medium]